MSDQVDIYRDNLLHAFLEMVDGEAFIVLDVQWEGVAGIEADGQSARIMWRPEVWKRLHVATERPGD